MEEEDSDESDEPVPVKKAPVKAAVQAKKPVVEESSEEEEEEEKVVPQKFAQKVAPV